MSIDIHIENCNNIKSADIRIEDENLNILFGRNGSGKTTISKSMILCSKGKSLEPLMPFGEKDIEQTITGIEEKSIFVFNDDYVESYLFEPNTLVKNAFDVFLKTPDYELAKLSIDKKLENIRDIINDNNDIKRLKEQIEKFLNVVKTTSSGQIAKRGGAKSILEGKGAFNNIPTELMNMKPLFDDDNVTGWVAWRLNGYEQYGKKGICPYCSTKDNQKSKQVNKAFNESFDKSSVKAVYDIITALDEINDYIDNDKCSELKKAFGLNPSNKSLEAKLSKLCVEAEYLYKQLNEIINFNGSSINKDDLKELENILVEMKIEYSTVDSYFTTSLAKERFRSVNDKIDELVKDVGILKGDIAKYNKLLSDSIENKQNDINDFLKLAGFNYKFIIRRNGENNAYAMLEYISQDGSYAEVESPQERLSWGEKNAFALIMFMFDAISKNADIIVLDDPISSFDRNKKYAIINRLFKTGDKTNSFYQRTAILLTHDFEPVIDYVKTHSGKQDTGYINAKHFENIEGKVSCKKIEQHRDIISSVVLFKELSKDKNMHIATRLGCLRKYLEHQYVNPRNESQAYNMLSSLMHRRLKASKDNDGNDLLSEEEKKDAQNEIINYISGFDFDNILDEYNAEKLLNDYYSNNISNYEKIMILRFYVEQDESARNRLRKYNDVLRKYVDETFHIENDYVYSLDVRRFNIVPDEYVKFANEFVNREIQLLNNK